MIRRMARTGVVVGALVLGALPAVAAAAPVVSLESTFATSWNGVPLGETWVRLERLVNSGDTAQTVTGITLGNASEFGLAGVAVGDVLPPHSSRAVQTTFTPQALGDRAGDARLTFSGSDDIVVSGTGDGVAALVRIVTGDAAAADGVLDFGDLELGGASMTRQLTITNISGQPLSTNACEQLFDAGFTVTADCPDFTVLAADASIQFGVVFTPAQVGAHGGTVTFSAQGIDHTLEMRVYARVISHAHTLTTKLDFADTLQHPATPTLQDLVLANTGTEPLSIPPATISGDGFGIVIGPGVGALLAGESATYTIGFAPPEEGVFDATLALATLGSVALHGTGISRAVSTDAALDFHGVVIGQSAAGSLTIHNAGAIATAVTAVASSDPRFVATLPADPSVPAGGDLVIGIAYSPTTTGNDKATLTIAFDTDPQPELSMALRGNGLMYGGGGCSVHHDGRGGVATVLLALVGLVVHSRRRRR
jgi:ASPM-SPD-2-Hydin domain-containing protein